MDADAGGSIVAAAWQRTSLSVCPGPSRTARELIEFETLLMTPHDYLTEDGLVMLLLCSSLGLDQKAPGFCSPLTLSEWNKLAAKVSDSPLKSPSGLLGHNASDLHKALELPTDEAERIAQLL